MMLPASTGEKQKNGAKAFARPQESMIAERTAVVGADRVLSILIELARRPEGASLDELARAVNSPKPTVHRALTSLIRARLASRVDVGRYILGDEFLRLAFAHDEARPDSVRIRGALQALTQRYSETAHYAVLDGDEVVYRAKVDPPFGGARLTSTVGGRNPAYCTAVGKLLLAYTLPGDSAVARWARSLTARTPHTITTADVLVEEIARIHRDGFSVDAEESELGIVCVAVPAFLKSPASPSGAVSVTALAYRTPLRRLVDDIRAIADIVSRTSTSLPAPLNGSPEPRPGRPT